MSFFTWRWLLPQKEQRSCSLPSLARATTSPCTSDRAERLPVTDHVVDDSVLLRLFRSHVVVALHVLRNLLLGLRGVLRDDLLEAPLQRDRLARLNLVVRALALEATAHLVDQDLRVRQRHALPLRPARENHGPHRHGDADADRLYLGLDELHGVVDRQTRINLPSRRVDVDEDVLVRVLGLQMQELGDHEVRDLVVDRSPQEDDPLVEQTGVDVERALSARGLLDHHRNQRAHQAGSLLPGVHSFVSVGDFYLSCVQICSRASASSTGIGLTSSASRSRAFFSLRSSRNWYAPCCITSSTAASGSSPCASALSRTSAAISSSGTSIPSWSAAASSTSSRATESAASCARRWTSSSGFVPVTARYCSKR